jgi:hypothetical protein
MFEMGLSGRRTIRSYLKNVFWPNPPEADQFHFVGALF